jgi:hypothetical protein
MGHRHPDTTQQYTDEVRLGELADALARAADSRDAQASPDLTTLEGEVSDELETLRESNPRNLPAAQVPSRRSVDGDARRARLRTAKARKANADAESSGSTPRPSTAERAGRCLSGSTRRDGSGVVLGGSRLRLRARTRAHAHPGAAGGRKSPEAAQYPGASKVLARHTQRVWRFGRD